MGDHVYHIAAPSRRLVVVDPSDPTEYIVRDFDIDPDGPTARVRPNALRPWKGCEWDARERDDNAFTE